MNDEIEPGRTAQTPHWWVSSAMVAAMDELKIIVPCESAITSQVLDVEHRADPKITGKIKLVGVGTKPPQNLV